VKVVSTAIQSFIRVRIVADELFFRVSIAVIFVGAGSISGHFRKIARQFEPIFRQSEATSTKVGRLLIALLLYLSILAFIVNPSWMEWSSFDVPMWVRHLAVGAGLLALPLVYWVMISIGNNISETVLTKENHELVTHGPYHWVRHPLYTVSILMLISVSLIAANWFMMMMTAIASIGIASLILPKEEAELVSKFGAEYRVYQDRTGGLLPRIFIHRHNVDERGESTCRYIRK